MPIPEENFKNLLADYAADTEDNGFSDKIIMAAQARAQKTAKKRKYALYAAMFLGGMISGSQLSALLELFSENSAFLSNTENSSYLGATVMGAAILGLTLWLVEQRDFSL